MADAVVLESEETVGLAEPGEFVDVVRDAYRERAAGARAEPRFRLSNPDPPGILTGYSAILPEQGVMGVYQYSAGFDSQDAYFESTLFDAHTGEPIAVLDGSQFNPLKTGAVGAVGVDALAREDASTLAMLGSGPQARSQLRAISTVRSLETVWVYSPTSEHREAFAGQMTEALDAAVAAVASSAAAVEAADIVVTATNADEPVVDDDRIADGAHITAMGQYHPDKRELEAKTVARSRYVPDLRARVSQDAGSFLKALETGAVSEGHVHAELGDVVASDAPGRESTDQITIFDSGGTGLETVAATAMLARRARDAGRGTEMELTPASTAFGLGEPLSEQ